MAGGIEGFRALRFQYFRAQGLRDSITLRIVVETAAHEGHTGWAGLHVRVCV